MATSAPFRRVVALALLALVVAAVWRAGVEPLWRAWVTDREIILERRDAIARLRGLAAEREAFEVAVEQAQRASGMTDALMSSPSATLAAADLQQRVKALVEEAGGSVVSAQPTDSVAAGPFTRIGLNVRMVISTTALQRVLHVLETRSPVVVIDEMLVLARGSRNTRRRVEVSDELDVRLQLAAFVSAVLERGAR